MSKYKKDIIRLRKKGKTYSEIEDELGCSMGVISHHCKNEGLTDIGKKQQEISDEKKKKIREYYKDHTREQTAKRFDVSESTVQKYGETKKRKETGGRKARKKDTCKTGDISEMKAKMKLLENGYTVSEPINSGSRYDLIADDGEELYKVQVKTAYNEDDHTSAFECRSHPQSGKKKVSYTKNEVDVFVVYSRKHKKLYWIEFEKAPKKSMTIRHTKPKNGQTKNVNYAKDFVM